MQIKDIFRVDLIYGAEKETYLATIFLGFGFNVAKFNYKIIEIFKSVTKYTFMLVCLFYVNLRIYPDSKLS